MIMNVISKKLLLFNNYTRILITNVMIRHLIISLYHRQTPASGYDHQYTWVPVEIWRIRPHDLGNLSLPSLTSPQVSFQSEPQQIRTAN